MKQLSTIFRSAFFFVSALALFSCGETPVYEEPALTVNPTTIELSQESGATATLEIVTNRAWTLKEEADWLTVSQTSGDPGSFNVTLTALPNEGIARSATITVTASNMVASVSVNQLSSGGESNQVTIAALREMYNAGTTLIDEEIVLTAVVVSDQNGNNVNQKNGYLQDATGALQFRMEAKHSFALGDLLSINLKGGFFSEYGGSLQLTFNPDYVSVAPGTLPAPMELSVMEVPGDGSLDGYFVAIKDVQFDPYEDLTYIEQSDGQAQTTNRTIVGREGGTLLVRTQYWTSSTFGYDQLPAGSGTLYGILSYYNSTPQLYLRNGGDDDEMTGDRFTIEAPEVENATLITVADVRNIAAGPISANVKVKGVVTSDIANGNINNKNVLIQDETAAVSLFFKDVASFEPGDEITIWLYGATSTDYQGNFQISDLDQTVAILESASNQSVPCVTTTIAEILAGNHPSQLVKIEGVEFTEKGVTFSGNRTITDGTDNVLVYTRNGASFAGELVPAGSGALIANVISYYETVELTLRSIEDVAGMSSGSYLTLSKSEITLSSTAASGSFDINTNEESSWSIAGAAEWCTLSATSGTGEATVTITLEDNTSSEMRSCEITVTAESMTALLTINQRGVSAGGAGTEIFISEYVEGSSNNKYLELYNPTTAAIDLTDYQIKLQTNGADEWGKNSVVDLSGSLAAGETIVLSHKDAAIYTGDVAISDGYINFNGNDPVGLFKAGTLIDVFGTFDGGDANFAKDKTYRRIASVKEPSTTFSMSDWEEFDKDDISGLGSHTVE